MSKGAQFCAFIFLGMSNIFILEEIMVSKIIQCPFMIPKYGHTENIVL